MLAILSSLIRSTTFPAGAATKPPMRCFIASSCYPMRTLIAATIKSCSIPISSLDTALPRSQSSADVWAVDRHGDHAAAGGRLDRQVRHFTLEALLHFLRLLHHARDIHVVTVLQWSSCRPGKSPARPARWSSPSLRPSNHRATSRWVFPTTTRPATLARERDWRRHLRWRR